MFFLKKFKNFIKDISSFIRNEFLSKSIKDQFLFSCNFDSEDYFKKKTKKSFFKRNNKSLF